MNCLPWHHAEQSFLLCLLVGQTVWSMLGPKELHTITREPSNLYITITAGGKANAKAKDIELAHVLHIYLGEVNKKVTFDLSAFFYTRGLIKIQEWVRSKS